MWPGNTSCLVICVYIKFYSPPGVGFVWALFIPEDRGLSGFVFFFFKKEVGVVEYKNTLYPKRHGIPWMYENGNTEW